MKKNNKLSVYEVNIGPMLGDENQARWAEKAVTIANYHTPSPDTYEAIGKDRLTVTVQAHPSRRVLGQELLDLGRLELGALLGLGLGGGEEGAAREVRPGLRPRAGSAHP